MCCPKLNSLLTVGSACTLCVVASLLTNCDLLADLDAEHVRRVLAAFLVEDHRGGRRVEEIVAEAVLDIDEDIPQPAVLGHEGLEGRAPPLCARSHVGSPDILIAAFCGTAPSIVTRPASVPALATSTRLASGRRRLLRAASSPREQPAARTITKAAVTTAVWFCIDWRSSSVLSHPAP